MITDIKVADKMLVIAPDIRIWSARRKMQAEDYGINATNLPPDDIASLGVKKLCPPESLRPFAMLKSRAVSLLSRIGIPFMPGSWLVPADKGNEISKTLEAIKREFDRAKEAFLSEYDAICANWQTQHPNHAEMLRNGSVAPDYVRSRLSFGWRAFALRMTKHSNLRDELANLGNSVFADIAREAIVVQREVFTDRQTVSQKALWPIRNLHDKLRGLAFVHPQISAAANLVQTCLERMPKKGEITGADLGTVLALVTLLSDPAALEDATLRMTQKKAQPETLLVPEPPAETEAIPVVQRPRSVIANVGLW